MIHRLWLDLYLPDLGKYFHAVNVVWGVVFRMYVTYAQLEVPDHS